MFGDTLNESTLTGIMNSVCTDFDHRKEWTLVSEYLKEMARLKSFNHYLKFVDKRTRNGKLMTISAFAFVESILRYQSTDGNDEEEKSRGWGGSSEIFDLGVGSRVRKKHETAYLEEENSKFFPFQWIFHIFPTYFIHISCISSYFPCIPSYFSHISSNF